MRKIGQCCKLLGCLIFQRRPYYIQIIPINISLLIEIRQTILKQYYGNYIEVKFSELYAWNWTSKKLLLKLWVFWRVILRVLVPKWCLDAHLANTMDSTYLPSSRGYDFGHAECLRLWLYAGDEGQRILKFLLGGSIDRYFLDLLSRAPAFRTPFTSIRVPVTTAAAAALRCFLWSNTLLWTPCRKNWIFEISFIFLWPVTLLLTVQAI